MSPPPRSSCCSKTRQATTASKLGLWLKKAGKFPYLVPADVYRPAAIEQLVRVGTSAGLIWGYDLSGIDLARVLAGLIDSWKNRALTPEKVPLSDADKYDNRGTELYEAYLRSF